MHATVLSVETVNKLLVSAPMLKQVSADIETHRYWQVSANTRYRYRSNPNVFIGICQPRLD